MSWTKFFRKLLRGKRRRARRTRGLVEAIHAMREEGLTLDEIARELQVSRKFVQVVLRNPSQPDSTEPDTANELRRLLAQYRELRELVSEISQLEKDRPAMERFLDTLAQTLGQGLATVLPTVLAQASSAPAQQAPTQQVPAPRAQEPLQIQAPPQPAQAPPVPPSSVTTPAPPDSLHGLAAYFSQSAPAEAAAYLKRLAEAYPEWERSVRLLQGLREEQVDLYLQQLAHLPDGGAELAAWLSANRDWTLEFLRALRS